MTSQDLLEHRSAFFSCGVWVCMGIVTTRLYMECGCVFVGEYVSPVTICGKMGCVRQSKLCRSYVELRMPT